LTPDLANQAYESQLDILHPYIDRAINGSIQTLENPEKVIDQIHVALNEPIWKQGLVALAFECGMSLIWTILWTLSLRCPQVPLIVWTIR